LRILSLKEASEYLKSKGVIVAPGTLSFQARKGVLSASLAGRVYVTTEKALNDYAAKHAGKPGAPKGNQNWKGK